jgi:hypothetical protein
VLAFGSGTATAAGAALRWGEDPEVKGTCAEVESRVVELFLGPASRPEGPIAQKQTTAPSAAKSSRTISERGRIGQ